MAEKHSIETAQTTLDVFTCLNKYVSVQILEKCSKTGFVHAVDPVSKSIILIERKDDKFFTTLIPGHAVTKLTEATPDFDEIPPKKLINELTPEEIDDRKTKIIAWLKKNLLPASERNKMVVIGEVSILPPFSSNDICTENPVVAINIKKIIDSMPENFTS